VAVSNTVQVAIDLLESWRHVNLVYVGKLGITEERYEGNNYVVVLRNIHYGLSLLWFEQAAANQ